MLCPLHLLFLGFSIALACMIQFNFVTSRSSFDWSRVAFSFLVVTVLAVLSLAVDLALSPMITFGTMTLNDFWTCANCRIDDPLQTTAEELLMRGFVSRFGVASKSRLAPLLITSFLLDFSLLESRSSKIGVCLISVYIITGLFLGIFTLMDEGLELLSVSTLP